jgi:hypothetical protein
VEEIFERTVQDGSQTIAQSKRQAALNNHINSGGFIQIGGPNVAAHGEQRQNHDVKQPQLCCCLRFGFSFLTTAAVLAGCMALRFHGQGPNR